MALQNATLPFNNPVNASLQIGDVVYYSIITSSGTFATVLPSNTVEFGTVSAISADGLSIDVVYEDDADGDGTVDVSPPGANDYISFAKDTFIARKLLVRYLTISAVFEPVLTILVLGNTNEYTCLNFVVDGLSPPIMILF